MFQVQVEWHDSSTQELTKPPSPFKVAKDQIAGRHLDFDNLETPCSSGPVINNLVNRKIYSANSNNSSPDMVPSNDSELPNPAGPGSTPPVSCELGLCFDNPRQNRAESNEAGWNKHYTTQFARTINRATRNKISSYHSNYLHEGLNSHHTNQGDSRCNNNGYIFRNYIRDNDLK